MNPEVLRRVALVLSLAAAVVLARLTPFEPLASLRLPEFEKGHARNNRPTPDGRTEGELSMEEYVSYVTGGRIIPVSGPEWTAFFDKVETSLREGAVPAGWEHRVTPEELESSRKTWPAGVKDWKDVHRLFFWVSEPPLVEHAESLTAEADYYFKLDSKPPRYLEAYHYPELRTTGLASGFYGIPRRFAYPYMKWSPWLILGGLLVYVLLPWPRRAADVAAVARWRVVGSDLASSGLLFLMFFAMPFFIVGSTVQAVTEWLLFSFVFWIVAGLGLLAACYSAVWGGFSVTVGGDRLTFGSLRGSKDLRYGDFASIQAATFQPPGWLIKTLWVLSLMGGRRGMLAAGQASIMGAAEAKGYVITARDGRKAFIWYTDQMGSTALTHFDQVEKALRDSGVPMESAPLRMKGVFPPFGD
ncbi:MAG: hypothetical protein HY924_08355 [Elusimicrobia bacterium]|nr:hypothetical protein [Elusimicrobiota bacterium]